MFVSESQIIKLQIIEKVAMGKMAVWQAAEAMGKSQRTVYRQLASFKKKGFRFIQHGNQGRAPHNKHPQDLKEEVRTLIREKYFDFNITHLKEKLFEEENLQIAKETLRRWAHELGLVKNRHHRRKKARYYRQRAAQRGLMVQMDGSPHLWFGKSPSTLISAIDDATSEVLYAEFFNSEDTINCMKVVRRIVERFGLFNMLYVDHAGIYGGHKRQNFSQLKRACEELGIHVIFASSPQGKGRVERSFRTQQDRLVAEMRLKGIQTFDEANTYLWKEFIPHIYNQKFAVPPAESTDAFVPFPCPEELKEIFCLKEHRVIAKNHTIQWQGNTYAFHAPDGVCIANHDIEIRTYPDRTWQALYRNRPIHLRRIHSAYTRYAKLLPDGIVKIARSPT